MDAIRRFSKPVLRRPRAVMAFEGWNDACEAATGSVEYLLGQAGITEPFAVIDPEEFFDFQVRRPIVSIGDGGTRSLTWPTTRFFAVEMPADERDLLLVIGEEPSFRWRTYSRHITQVLVEMDVEEAVLLGAFIGQVAHTRPVPVIGVATEPEMVIRHGLLGSTYEGPTGIVGVLQEACREVGLPAISLWAATPHYLSANANPRAMLALLGHTAEILDLAPELGDLETAAQAFDERVAHAMESSGDLAQYIEGLEAEPPETAVNLDPTLAAYLVTEIESFLRDQE
jgi:proteasome assembly chaperone (PAC2) family protein